MTAATTNAIAAIFADAMTPEIAQRIDDIVDTHITPTLIRAYGHHWNNLTMTEAANRVGACITEMVRILKHSDNPADNRAAAIIIARACA